MTERIVNRNMETDYEPKIVSYEGEGSSVILVGQPGEVVDLMNGTDKYLKSPDRNPMGRVMIAGRSSDGDQVRLVIDQNYAVAFGVDRNGKQFHEVGPTHEEDFAALHQPLTIGEVTDAFGQDLAVSAVGAEYKAFGGGAEEERKGSNPFTVADSLIARHKRANQHKS